MFSRLLQKTCGGCIEDMLYRITGAGLTSLSGMRGQTILQIISEISADMSKFPDAKHFASYLENRSAF